MLTARDFQRAAEQRFTAAEFLLQSDFTLEALYLAGYCVECILKALIMNLTPEDQREATYNRLTAGAKMHYHAEINKELKNLDLPIPIEIAKRLRRFDWYTDLRYESGRKPLGEVRGYLKTAQITLEWAQGEMA